MSAQPKAVWFPHWREALRDLRLPPLHKLQYRLALLRYLLFCKKSHRPATVESARDFISSVQRQRLLSVSMLATWKEALNWFFETSSALMSP